MSTISSPLLCVGITLFLILRLTLTLLFGSWIAQGLQSRFLGWFPLHDLATCCLNARWWFFRGTESRIRLSWSSLACLGGGVLCYFGVNRRLNVTGHCIIIILLPSLPPTRGAANRKKEALHFWHLKVSARLKQLRNYPNNWGQSSI